MIVTQCTQTPHYLESEQLRRSQVWEGGGQREENDKDKMAGDERLTSIFCRLEQS